MKRLARGTVPPAFALLDAGGEVFDWRDLLEKRRLLIAFSPSVQWLRVARSRDHDLRDYELQILVLAPELGLQDPTAMVCVGFTDGETRRAYGVAEDEAVAFLVGKDGSVKEIYEGEPDLDAIFALIETMPMRRAEVARRGGKS